MNCLSCGYERVPAGARWCPKCGRDLPAPAISRAGALSNKIIDYRELITRSTKGFVGRQWVRDAVDGFLQAGGPRYFLLLGEPGSGKTTFLADLIQRRGYPHHFIGKGSLSWLATSLDWRNPIRFAESLGYQLLRDYGGWIMDWGAEGIQVKQEIMQEVRDLQGLLIGAALDTFQAVPRPADRPVLTVEQEVKQFGPAARAVGVYIENLQMDPEQVVRQLLTGPLMRITRRWPQHQIVLVVDGLDEAEGYSDPRHNILHLLPDGSLPPQVRFLLSSRPGEHLSHDFLQQVQPFWLSEDEQGQQNRGVMQDAKDYVVRLVEEEPVREMLEVRNLAAGLLGDKVAEASRGNFLYLYHYAQGLRGGDETLLDPKALPQGLTGIYRDFLTKIKHNVNDVVYWDQRFKPVLGALAVARQPLSLNQIADFTGVAESTVGTILTLVRQFLDSAGPEEDRRYLLYHLSFSDYLISHRNPDRISGHEAHERIVAHYRRHCAGDWSKLPDDDYGLFYLAAHLSELGQEQEYRQELYRLLDRPYRDRKFKRLGTDLGFLNDLGLAVGVAKRDDLATGLMQSVRAGFISAVLGQVVGSQHEIYRALSLLGGEKSVDAGSIANRLTAAHVLLEKAQRLAQQRGCIDREILDLLETAVKRAEEADDSYQEKTIRRQVACLQAQADLDAAVATVNPRGYGDSLDLSMVLREGARYHPEAVLKALDRGVLSDDREAPRVYAAVITALIEQQAEPDRIEAALERGLGATRKLSRAALILGLSELAMASYPLAGARSRAILHQAEELCTQPDRYDSGLRFLALALGRTDWTEAKRLAALIQDPPVAAQTWAELARLVRDSDLTRAKAAYEEAGKWAYRIDPDSQATRRKNWIRTVAMETAEIEGRYQDMVNLSIEDMWGEGRRQGDLTIMLRNFAQTLTEALDDDDGQAYRYALGVIDQIPERYHQERFQVLGNAAAFLAESRPGLALALLAEALRRQNDRLQRTVGDRIQELKVIEPDPGTWQGWPGYWEQKLAYLGDNAWRWMDATTMQAQTQAARDLAGMEALLTGLRQTTGLAGTARRAACQLLSDAYQYTLEEEQMPGLIGDAEALSCLGAGVVAHLLTSEPDRAIQLARDLPDGTSGRVEALARVAAHKARGDPAQAQELLHQAQEALQSVDSYYLDRRAASYLVRHWATVDPQAAWRMAGLQPEEWPSDIPEDDYPFSSRITIEKIAAAMSDVDLEKAIEIAGIYSQFFERYLAVIAYRMNEQGSHRVAEVVSRLTDPVLLGQLAARFIEMNRIATLEAWGQLHGSEVDAFFEGLENFVAFLPPGRADIHRQLGSWLEEGQAFFDHIEEPLVEWLMLRGGEPT
jgi:hypothetical protein